MENKKVKGCKRGIYFFMNRLDKQTLKRISEEIHLRTLQDQRINKDACREQNWRARMNALLFKHKAVWPPPKKNEIEGYKRLMNLE